ncbi:hypothetical protein NHQ30_000398 [Ciborinia camelliae]|nr:hypothetical protein NHQ30_000398 [Ciborinia camelliae]
MVDQEYQSLINLFSNLQIHDQIFYPPGSPNLDFASLNKSTHLGNPFSFEIQAVNFSKRSKYQTIGSLVSRRQRLLESEKNKKLYRHLQLNRCNGSLPPLNTFTLFSKLPSELRIKIWQFSFTGRRIVVDSNIIRSSGRNCVRTPNPVQLLINRESRAEVKLYYNFTQNWWARRQYQDRCSSSDSALYKNPFTPKFGAYYHSEIDELIVLPEHQAEYQTSLVRCHIRYWFLLTDFSKIQTLVISEAIWTTFDIQVYNYLRKNRLDSFKWIYGPFRHLREIVIYPGKLVVRTDKDNLLYTEMGRKQCLDFFKEVFEKAQKANPEITIRVPVFTIHHSPLR